MVGVLLYLLVSYVTLTTGLGLVLTPECIDVATACSRVEDAMAVIFVMLWLVAAVVLIVVGWRGRLPGFRGARTSTGPAAN